MLLDLEEKSVNWFKKEMHLHDGDAIRFFARYGGESTIQPGFSLGVCAEQPENVAASSVHEGLTFFVRHEDTWFFDGANLHVMYLESEDSVLYVFESAHVIRIPDSGCFIDA